MIAWIFAGQGSQVRGMGAGLFERFPELTRQASEILGYAVDELCHTGENLSLTQFTQPALFVTNALLTIARREQDERPPDLLAGHSLGEYNALFAAGAFDFATGLRLVQRRGGLMSEAREGGMVAALGPGAEVRAALDEAGLGDVDVANLNSPKQTVVAGLLESLPAAEAAFKARRIPSVRLKVSAAFHSRYMKPAREAFARVLEEADIRAPRLPVIANATARLYPRDAGAVRALLAEQIVAPVRWDETVRRLLDAGAEDIIEFGPKPVLTRLVREVESSIDDW